MSKRGRGHDKRGRTTGGEKFARMFLATMQTRAWRALTPYAQRLYPWLVLQWTGGHENNNGSIRLSVRQAAECLDCNSETARKALADLQRKGFLYVTQCAALGVTGEARGHKYELTELGRPIDPKPQRLYLEWKPGKDFAVTKAAVHNPTGKGGLRESRTQTYGVSPAQLTGPEGPDLLPKSNGAKKGDFPTYGVSHSYLPRGSGEKANGADVAGDTYALHRFAMVCNGVPTRVGVRSLVRSGA